MPNQNYKLGKRPFEPSPHDFKLTPELLTTPLPPIPTRQFGHGTLFADGDSATGWKMLGNDGAGDCVEASGAHQTMMFTRLGHHVAYFDKGEVLAEYSAVTGYDPSDPNSDQGTNVRDFLSYRRKTGMKDINGNRHKIDAYVSIDPGDWDLMLRCVWTFGAAELGIECQENIFDQFDAGEPLTYDSKAQIIGGHDIPVVASRNPTKEVTAISWGGRLRISKDYYEHRNDETWIPLSFEQMLSSGYNVRHIDKATLDEMLKALPTS